MAREKKEEVVLSATRCKKCHEFLERDPKKVRVLFDIKGKAALYHPVCAKKITGGESTGRPMINEITIQNKKINIKMSLEDKKRLRKIADKSKTPMAVLIKNAFIHFLITYKSPINSKVLSMVWSHKPSQTNLIIAVNQTMYDDIMHFSTILKVPMNVLLVQIAMNHYVN